MKLGTLILTIVAMIAIGSFLTPLAAILWALMTFSIGEIVRGFLILYVAMIPVCMFMDAKNTKV